MDEVEIGGLRIAGLHGAHLRVATPGRSPTVRIRRDVLAAAGLDEIAAVGLEIESAAAVEAQRGRTGVEATEPRPLAVTVPPPPAGRGQLLLVEDAGAFHWVVPDRARGGRRGCAGRELVHGPPRRRGRRRGRGLLGSMAKRVLRVLTFELDDAIAGRVGDEFVRRWEEHHRPYRLRTFRPEDYRLAAGRALDADEIRALGDGPALLLVHGTNALAHTGFGDLPNDVVRRLAERYGGRVVAFDHPTLSVDPAENCRQLLAMIPDDAGLELDILAHSAAGWSPGRSPSAPPTSGPIRLASACARSCSSPRPTPAPRSPTRTTSASLVDAMTNLLDAVPEAPTSPVVETLAGIVSIVKQLAVGAAGGLDGLLAMRPASSDPAGFLAELNRPRPVTARYRAVSADYEPTAGSGLSRVAINAFIDRLFAHESNDLIIPTLSAYRWNGASAFPISERLVLPAERGVDHSSFWASGEVIQALDTWLTSEVRPPGPGAPVGPLGGGDEPDPLADVDDRLAAGDIDGVRAAIRALPERHRRDLEQEVGALLVDRFARGAETPKAGRVFVLHGIMGSLLAAEGAGSDLDRIWINPLRLLGGGFARLRHPARDPIRAVGLHRTYLPLLIGLDADWEVVPFAYDWRLGLDAAAAELAERIDGPAHLVAHSMGGLRLPDVAGPPPRVVGSPGRRRRPRGGRSSRDARHAVARITVDRHGADGGGQAGALAGQGRRPPQQHRHPAGHRQLPRRLPAAPCGDAGTSPLLEASSWRDGQINGAWLVQARRVAELLAADGFDDDRMLYVAGTGHTTAAELRVDGPGRFRFRVTHLGDGRVTHDSGLGRERDRPPGAHQGLVLDSGSRRVGQGPDRGRRGVGTAPPRRHREAADHATGEDEGHRAGRHATCPASSSSRLRSSTASCSPARRAKRRADRQGPRAGGARLHGRGDTELARLDPAGSRTVAGTVRPRPPRQPRARQPPRRRRALRGGSDRRRRGVGRRTAPRSPLGPPAARPLPVAPERRAPCRARPGRPSQGTSPGRSSSASARWVI